MKREDLDVCNPVEIYFQPCGPRSPGWPTKPIFPCSPLAPVSPLSPLTPAIPWGPCAPGKLETEKTVESGGDAIYSISARQLLLCPGAALLFVYTHP